jgi:hypothetical protein
MTMEVCMLRVAIIVCVLTLVAFLSVHGEVGGDAIKEQLKRDLWAIEFNKILPHFVDHAQMARQVAREELRHWPHDPLDARCLMVLEKVGEKDDAMRALPFLHAGGDGFIRWRALLVVTTHGDERTLGAIEMCLYDENPSVRRVAIDYLEKQKNKWSAEAFHRFLEFEPKSPEIAKDQDRVRASLKQSP